MPDYLLLLLIPLTLMGWCFALYLISLCGWKKLAGRYAAPKQPIRDHFRMESLRLYLTSLCGWCKLANRHASSKQPIRDHFRMESLRLGSFINYGGVLTIIVRENGLYIRPWPIFSIGHPPLLIPWKDFHHPKRIVFLKSKISFDIAESGFSKITLSEKVILASPLAQTIS